MDEDLRQQCLNEAHISAVERFYRLEGKKVADIPPMAFLWTLDRRWWSIGTVAWTGLGIFNVVLSELVGGSVVNMLVVPWCVWNMIYSERKARRAARVLKRRAAEQLVRQRLMIFD